MLTKTTKQLIEDARVLGGVYNSDFTNFQISTSLLNDIYRSLYDDLTEEDKKYLRLKWGKTYKPEEWVRLE